MDSLPPDILCILVYSSGLACVEDRTSLVLSCRSVMDACGMEQRFASDGGEAHWHRESQIAGYVGRKEAVPASWRTVYFERKAMRCASCNVPITHRTGRMTTTGCHGTGVQLSSCVRCGPLVHVKKTWGLDVHIFGSYACRRQLELIVQRAKATRQHDKEERHGSEVKAALTLSGMSPEQAEVALAGSAAFGAYVKLAKASSVALTGTVANICRRHWMNSYTWLPCASALCGLPLSDATKEHLYSLVLKSYVGYPEVWPWSSSSQVSDREILADTMVEFYADSMMLDALFQRVVQNSLAWIGDHAWLSRIRDAVVRQHARSWRSRARRAVTFVTMNPGMRVAQLVLEAEFVGGFRIRRSPWHVTFTVQ